MKSKHILCFLSLVVVFLSSIAHPSNANLSGFYANISYKVIRAVAVCVRYRVVEIITTRLYTHTYCIHDAVPLSGLHLETIGLIFSV